MSKPDNYSITEKLWAGNSPNDKKRLFELLIISSIIQLVALLTFIIHIFSDNTGSFLFNFGVLVVPALAIICILNNKLTCALNTLFTIPLFIYAFYISDFNDHPPLIETVYHSVWWLVAGLVVLFYFSESTSKIIFYYIFALVTLGFQFLKSNQLFSSFSIFNPLMSHPIIVFTAVFAGGLILRNKYNFIVADISDKLKATNSSISKVFQESVFSIVQINAERDEARQHRKTLD